MIFRIRSPKGIFGQNMSDLRNGPLTGVSRSQESAFVKTTVKVFRNPACVSSIIVLTH